ncbi:MAG: hypothetical protein M1829_006079 [Trizodia sp. TS-e1964]|nr:MAG: hypothetical protein M1829_006079 [Trizodia sp. TS-e1964]
MALFNPTFVLGVLVLLYLSSFAIFAILRMITGISIQRVGYFSLRRIAYIPKDGIKIEIRGLGLLLHRPTFAQPTWVSVILSELVVTIDPKALADGQSIEHLQSGRTAESKANGQANSLRNWSAKFSSPRSKTWEQLTNIKDKIKRLHRMINWLRMVDVVLSNSSCVVTEVGIVQVGSFTMAVDTRRKTVDRRRLFQHRKGTISDQRPAEWMFTIRGVLFTPDGKDSLEIVDHCSLNIHGLLLKELDGLRDAAISLKLGRVHIPYDDVLLCWKSLRLLQHGMHEQATSEIPEIMVTDTSEVQQPETSREEKIVQVVSDSKEFISSTLRGIKEIQFAFGFVGLSKEIQQIQPSSSPLYLNITMKEVGIDLHRLDPKSPAHRMYFSPDDIAHQALLAAISISIGIGDGGDHPERLVYIPMATATAKTTLPSKTVELTEPGSSVDRNANILFANIVVTSPSIDLVPKHLPLVLALLRQGSSTETTAPGQSHHLMSRLLPKANIKLSIHEPVLRVVLPSTEIKRQSVDDYDLLISSISSISLDVESSHSPTGDNHYSLTSSYRVSSHQFYYQTALGARFDLLLTEAMEVKVQVSATPEVQVIVTGNLQTFSIHLVRPEISEGVSQIFYQLQSSVMTHDKSPLQTASSNFLRQLPPWLLQFQFQGSDFGVEIAGIDSEISKKSRGFALQLESWTADYRIQRADVPLKRQSRRRAGSRSVIVDENFLKTLRPSTNNQKFRDPTDGRRLAFHVHGLEGFVVESMDNWEPDPFLSVPRFEVALTTSRDSQGPIFHINTHFKTIFVQYSLYRYYAIGVAYMVLRKAFMSSSPKNYEPKNSSTTRNFAGEDTLTVPKTACSDLASLLTTELVTVDLKASFVQVKTTLPTNPQMLLQIFSLETGQHRWCSPFLKAKLLRVSVESANLQKYWARIASIKSMRIDYRESRRKIGPITHSEKSIDLVTEAVRLAVPHQVIIYKVLDNIVNAAKATSQLHHRFKTETNEYILEKHPEGPKNVPNISLRSKSLLFELEDGLFEWKLGTIYRVGLVEQKLRLARHEAFVVKLRKLQKMEQRRDSSRKSSAHPRVRSRVGSKADSRHRSQSPDERTPLETRPGRQGRQFRYDPEGVCHLSESAKLSAEEAWNKLQILNAQSWKRRIKFGLRFQMSAMKEIREVFWGTDEIPHDVEETEMILQLPSRPGLMATLISDLNIQIRRPSFPVHDYANFLHKVGKGMPKDMKYSLLIPMSVQIDMGEARITLRDYPLPLLHVPAIRPGQPPRLPSLSLKTDFVIAEEYRDIESMRHVRVCVVPPDNTESDNHQGGFAVDVRRTVSPVKTYSDITIDINTSYATRFTWGTSYQPCIQEMMMIIENFTKPVLDPSDRVGFWDKIRLSFHSRVSVSWKGDGDVHLMLKGSRDPYVVTNYGAGFVMCWRNDVRWNICQEEDPRKFMTVDSGEYVLAIPDYSHQARQTMETPLQENGSISTSSSLKNGALFKKVIMKLSGDVRLLAGLVFERNVNRFERSFDFRPHYEVTFKTPAYAKAPPGEVYDAYKNFRSHHIHLSVAVIAPLNRKWSVSNVKPSASYNTVHLTPRFFTHFYNWWSLFSGTMSLPIRQGPLWPGIEKSSKKFGRHLATIKYNVLLSPLFISHIYKHKDAEDYEDDLVSATGLKVRLDSFMLDLHQRREQFYTQVKGRKTQLVRSGMRINQAQLDFISADIRAVSASIAGTTTDDLKRATQDTFVSFHQPATQVDMSKFTIPDNDFSWIDMDDFVELDWILPAESNPETKIIPLAFAPRFTYFRQTDHHDELSGESKHSSAFGNELTHYCVMSQDNDPRRVQCDLIKERLHKLEEQMQDHDRAVGESELKCSIDEGEDGANKVDLDNLHNHTETLRQKKRFLRQMLKEMNARLQNNVTRVVPEDEGELKTADSSAPEKAPEELKGMDSIPGADFISDFNNRFIGHNMQIKWNNSLRNIILRYVHQVSQRRGFVYYMSRRAVKFILDIVEEQNKSKTQEASSHQQNPSKTSSRNSVPLPEDDEGKMTVEERIKQLLADANKFVKADDPDLPEGTSKGIGDTVVDHISHDYTPQNSYYVRLIAPQIQLQSEKNEKAAVLVTAKGMQLKVIQIMDKDRVADDVSGLVQRRFFADMESVQFFVSNQKLFNTKFLHLYSGNQYGAPAGSSWPPWVPLEVMFDFQVNQVGFARVVQKTSASLRYDKYNTLRLKFNDEVSSDDQGKNQSSENTESKIDHLWVEFPQVRAICDSSQYYAMYVIVLDLLLFSEPLEKVRSERLEKIMLASDFSDLRGAPEMVIRLQEKIRQLEEIKMLFQVNAKYLDRQGWEDRISIQQDLSNCEDELFFMMKAITTSQRKYEDRSQGNGLLRWFLSASEVVWHLMREDNEPLVEFQLKNAVYDRTDNNDGSHYNAVQIGKVNGINLLPNAVYPEMIAPYFDESKMVPETHDTKMLEVYWYMLEAIAGIPVMDHFEVNLIPLRIQLEREVGKKLFEYIFPDTTFEKGDESPLVPKPKHLGDDEYGINSSSAETDSALDSAYTKDSSVRRSLESRLRPTMALSEQSRPNTSAGPKNRFQSGGQGDSHHFRLFQSISHSKPISRPPTLRVPVKKASADSLRMTPLSAIAPLTSRRTTERSSASTSTLNQSSATQKSSKFKLSHGTGSSDKDLKPSDDLTQMISRASNFMTLAYVKIPSVVLCLSYKGKGERNIEDVHNFVFRMPTLEYRNKTWSNLDLALQLKKDVIKALISHTGAIIGNKFSHHRPSKSQQSRLREIVNNSSVLGPTQDSSVENSETSSIMGSVSPADEKFTARATPPPPTPSTLAPPVRRNSLTSMKSTFINRTESFASSVRFMKDPRSPVIGQTTNPPPLPQSDTPNDNNHGFIHNKLTRHLTNLGQKSRNKEVNGSEDSEESSRRKGKLLLGKKFLGSLG